MPLFGSQVRSASLKVVHVVIFFHSICSPSEVGGFYATDNISRSRTFSGRILSQSLYRMHYSQNKYPSASVPCTGPPTNTYETHWHSASLRLRVPAHIHSGSAITDVHLRWFVHVKLSHGTYDAVLCPERAFRPVTAHCMKSLLLSLSLCPIVSTTPIPILHRNRACICLVHT